MFKRYLTMLIQLFCNWFSYILWRCRFGVIKLGEYVEKEKLQKEMFRVKERVFENIYSKGVEKKIGKLNLERQKKKIQERIVYVFFG